LVDDYGRGVGKKTNLLELIIALLIVVKPERRTTFETSTQKRKNILLSKFARDYVSRKSISHAWDVGYEI